MTTAFAPEDFVTRISALIAVNPRLNAGIEILRERRAEFDSDLEMMLTGIAALPEARQFLDTQLDALFDTTVPTAGEDADEVVIGGGIHAAIYCAARVRMGFPKPLVLEQHRVGGTFAMSRRASFYLNSRNRPGRLSLPREAGSLNYLPGASIQPANLSMSEFQTNADLAWVIRLTLAQYGFVRTGARVSTVESTSGERRRFRVVLADNRLVHCDRVIDARGLGGPLGDGNADGVTIRTFPQLMAAMDDPFPLRGMKRVAVVGAGDSARVAVESLLGIGPAEHMSTARLDFVESIDWYAPSLANTCDRWRDQERGRYQSIGSFLSQPGQGRERLRVFNQRGYASKGLDTAYVNDRVYDCAIVATGFFQYSLGGAFDEYTETVGDSPVIARQYGDQELYAVGPSADLSLTSAELSTAVGLVDRNRDAIFRYAPRTAALATRLPAA